MSLTRSVLRPFALALALPVLAGPAAQAQAQAQAQTQAETQSQIAPTTALAETAPELRALLADMGFYQILEVMSAEGIAGGPEMEADMFPGRGGAAWAAVVAGIYSADRMARDFEAALPLDRLTPEHIDTLRAFYATDIGAFAQPIPEDLMLTEVWGQEAEIRADLTEWLYAYQTLAYDDLEDAQLRAYIDLTATEAGQALNAALFAGFAALFDSISYDLGVAAAHFISGEET
jgi:hypothetical protein